MGCTALAITLTALGVCVLTGAWLPALFFLVLGMWIWSKIE